MAPWFAPRSRWSAWVATRSSSSVSRCRSAATEARLCRPVRSGSSTRVVGPRARRGRRGTARPGPRPGAPLVRRIPLPYREFWHRPPTLLVRECGYSGQLWRSISKVFWCPLLDHPDSRRGFRDSPAPPGRQPQPRAVPLPVTAPFKPMTTRSPETVSTPALWRSLLDHRRGGAPPRPPPSASQPDEPDRAQPAAPRSSASTLGNWRPSMEAITSSCPRTCSARAGRRWSGPRRRPWSGSHGVLGEHVAQEVHPTDAARGVTLGDPDVVVSRRWRASSTTAMALPGGRRWIGRRCSNRRA